ncbi:hypothetical protein [Geosporobacter ferrireducens]|uniref:Uncharacterized protein n=1 Tax=Geosporobacter ferrireducens TaxID=1424294 RepID=A0A1D8GE20_9FIRM|nr:hypothetical protein [Geosporobacter ferrireducens]AOT69159.1 hypothetical protein Gferi_06035 [Geosporobacter ferrireducens]MTI56836.1 hypothetical protein [Geosporobacter ferrireducens]
MLQKIWVRLFIWFMTIFFFFLASAVIISMFKPGPTENEVMLFMMGMMSAMDNSMMGAAMNIIHDNLLLSVINLTTAMALPIIIFSIMVGLGLRLTLRRDSNAS